MGVKAFVATLLGIKGKNGTSIHSASNPVATEDQVSKDWDESDRAKVNPIVGQAGVSAGAGATDAKTQRVVQASDSEIGIRGVDRSLYRFALRADTATFGTAVASPKSNQFEIQFFKGSPDTLMSVAAAGSGNVSHLEGLGHFNTGTDATASVTATSHQTVHYSSGNEVYVLFTAAWATPPTGASDAAYVDFGDGDDGYQVGYRGATWGLRHMRNGSEVDFIAASAFSEGDILNAGNAEFTRAGAAESLNPAKMNIFRLRFGWLSAAPTHLDAMAPDGHWVELHIIKHPNNNDSGQTTSPNQPVRVVVSKTASDATDVELRMGCIGAGIVAPVSVGQQPDGDFVPTKADGTAFSEETNLVASAAFTSSWFDSDGWRSIEVFVATDQVSATNGIEVQYTDNVQATTPTVRASIRHTFTAQDVSRGFAIFYVPTALDGFRVKYTNGGVDQTSFYLAANLRTQAVENPQGPIESVITETDNALQTRAVLTAKDSVDGSYNNVLATPPGDSITEPTRLLDGGAYTYGYDDDSGTWNRIRSRQPVDNMTNPGKALNVAGFNMLWNPDGSPANRWNRFVGKPLADAQAEQLAALVGARVQLWNGSGWDRARGDTANGLDVDVTRLPGTVAADIAAMKTALQIIDDWDETDRAAVNLISGQAGVAADAGATGANVQRVVEANPTAGSTTTATAGATATTPLSADNHRVSTLISNEGAGTARVAIGGTTPTASLGEQLLPGDRMVVPGGPEIQVIREGAVNATLQLSEVKHA